MKEFIMEMPAQLKKDWLAALRSGKYQQCTGTLMGPTLEGKGYCCLGVLQMVADGEVEHYDYETDEAEGPKESPTSNWYKAHGMSSFLEYVPNVPGAYSSKAKTQADCHLTNRNDGYMANIPGHYEHVAGIGFPEIADWIEENVRGVVANVSEEQE